MSLENLPLRSLFAISRQMQKSGSPRFDKPPSRAERAISALSRKTGVHRSTIAGKAETMGKYLDTDALVGRQTGKIVKSAIRRAKSEKGKYQRRLPSVSPTEKGASLRNVSEKAESKALKNAGTPLAKHFLRKAEILGTAGQIADRMKLAKRSV